MSSRPPCKIKPVSFTYIIYCTLHNNIDPLCLYLTHRDVEFADTLGQKIFGCCMIVYLESASLKVKFTEFLSVLNLFYTIIKPSSTSIIVVHHHFAIFRDEQILNMKYITNIHVMQNASIRLKTKL